MRRSPIPISYCSFPVSVAILSAILISRIEGQATLNSNSSSSLPTSQARAKQQDIQQLITSLIDTSQNNALSNEVISQSIEALTNELRQSPRDINLLIGRAAANLRLGKGKDAANDLAEAIRLAPNDATAWYVLGQMKVDSREYQGAIAAFKKAETLGFRDPQIFMEYGWVYENLGDEKQAIAMYSKAIESKCNKAYGRRAQLYFALGQVKNAIADYDKAIASWDTQPGIYISRARAHQAAGHPQEAIRDYTHVIQVMPDWAEAYLGRAQMYDAIGKWDEALRDFGQAIRLDPQAPDCVAARGCAYIEHRDFEKGIADINTAIGLNPGDLGKNYRPLSQQQLSSDAIAHGENQVRQMLKDRPAMAQHVQPGDKLWTWAVRKFAGEDTGELIDWDAQPPIVNSGSSREQLGIANAAINIDPKLENFEELWRIAVFELHNQLIMRELKNLRQRVELEQIDRDAYVSTILTLEIGTTQRTRAFYIDVYLDWFQKSTLQSTNPRSWYCNDYRSPDDVSVNDERPAYYASQFYYLSAIREFKRKDFIRAREFLQKMITDKDGIPQLGVLKAYTILGQVNGAMGDFKSAIEDFTKALAIEPNDAVILWLRGAAYTEKGQFDLALNDYDRAINLNPDFEDALVARSREHWRRGTHKAALADVDTIISNSPTTSWAYTARAKLLLESKDATVRNPAEALTAAKRSCALTHWDSAYELRLLARAYAELSDFDNAVKWQEKAVSICDPAEKENYSNTLKSYKQKQQERERVQLRESGNKVMWVERVRLAA